MNDPSVYIDMESSILKEMLYKLPISTIRTLPEYRNASPIKGNSKSKMKKNELIDFIINDIEDKKELKMLGPIKRKSPEMIQRHRSFSRGRNLSRRIRSRSRRRKSSDEQISDFNIVPFEFKVMESDRRNIINTLKEIGALYTLVGNSKKHAYLKAVDQLEDTPYIDNRSIQKIKGIGPSIMKTIQEILERKPITKINEILASDKFQEIKDNIHTLEKYLF